MRTRRGEPSLAVDALELLAKIRSPLPDTFHGLTDVEQRYRRRYLDLLMNEESRARRARPRADGHRDPARYLDGEGFVEVETPILQPRYGGGFAEPFVTHSNELDQDLYLRIADELYLKRLLVGGLEKVYEISKDFRNESISYKHSPEFTQLEWYEAYADYRDTMERAETLVETRRARVQRDDEVDVPRPRGRLREAVAAARVRRRARGARRLVAGRRRAAREARGRAASTPAATGRGRSSSTTRYSHFVEPGLIQPTIVYDWPIELSPFARTTDDDPTLVERFESVVGGMEFANAFSELNDSVEQAERFAMQEAEREAGDAEAEPGDPDYVEALSFGMPPTGGIGIGMDRLAMVLLRQGLDPRRDPLPGAARARPRPLTLSGVRQPYPARYDGRLGRASGRSRRRRRERGSPMFERFTERARQVVVLAQDEARALKHNYIGTEHILLGLLREEEGLAARVLESLDITVEEVRAQVARIVGQGDEVTTGQIPFTPRAKKVLELALREALSLGHNYIGTEHILLGLVRENEGVAARILLDFDADAEKIRNEIIRMLSGPGRRQQGRAAPRARSRRARSSSTSSAAT